MKHRMDLEDEQRDIHVLAVDDSAVVREMMSLILPDSNGLTVSVAADPVIAMRKIDEHRPDVILLDLEMPRIDGLSFLKHIMTQDPIPVVICSAVADRGTKIALEALARGAFDVLVKPKRGIAEFIEKSAPEFRMILRAAAKSAHRNRARARTVPIRPLAKQKTASPRLDEGCSGRFEVVAIGTSTGGPQALTQLLGELDPSCPGLVIVQHMPPSFTTALASRLNDKCEISVHEASHGDIVSPGTALISPGDRHLMLVRSGPRFSVALADGPNVNGHKPSVDVLFKSVARAAGSRACGVILTGMGSDGACGLAEMRKAGALTLGESEASCVVYGMPQRAFEIGAVERVVDLSEVARAIENSGED